METDLFDSELPQKHFWQRRRIAGFFDPLFDLRIASEMGAVRCKARSLPERKVLVAAVEVPARAQDLQHVLAKISESRHRVSTCVAPMGARGKFDNINHALQSHDLSEFDWLIVTDDDVAFPPSFLDDFLYIAEAMHLKVAQPAHRCLSYATFTFNYRKWNTLARATKFVECGPVTAFHRDIIPFVVPFPPLRWAWGIDVSWSVIAEQHGMSMGIVDATPIEHLREVARTYSVEPAVKEAREFLAKSGIQRKQEDLFVDMRVVRAF